MILETIFSTLDLAGKPNFAPMGVVWDEEKLIIRPFRDTRTCYNLLGSGWGVVNVTDDVLAFVQCGLYHLELPHSPAEVVPGAIFQGVCAWREVQVMGVGGDEERAEFRCRVVHMGRRRDFLGFCRAQYAVLEAEILATRLHLGDSQGTMDALKSYAILVEKTGGETEKIAIQQIQEYVRKWNKDDAQKQSRS